MMMRRIMRAMGRALCLALGLAALAGCAPVTTPTGVPTIAVQAPAGSPVARHGALHVAGGRVVDSHGQPVTLRGMSLFWSQ